MKKLTILCLFIFSYLGCAVGPEGDIYDMSDCLEPAIIMSDCGEPNEVSCTCLTANGMVKVVGKLESHIICTMECTPYKN